MGRKGCREIRHGIEIADRSSVFQSLEDPMLIIGDTYRIEYKHPGGDGKFSKNFELIDITKHGIYVFFRAGYKAQTFLKSEIPAALQFGVIQKAR